MDFTLDEIRWSITLQSTFQTQGTPRVGKARGGTQGFQQPVGGAVSSVCIFVRAFKAVFQSMNYNARDLGLSFIPAPNPLSKPQLPHH